MFSNDRVAEEVAVAESDGAEGEGDPGSMAGVGAPVAKDDSVGGGVSISMFCGGGTGAKGACFGITECLASASPIGGGFGGALKRGRLADGAVAGR